MSAAAQRGGLGAKAANVGRRSGRRRPDRPLLLPTVPNEAPASVRLSPVW